ncbi:MAG: creatininase family protein [Bacteroidota bacterium]|nr:creatininase family protein [Bacteroidota bacterium]
MPIRPYILAETNWKNVKETKYDVAILPWAATEAHNYHLPYSTDTLECDHIAAESARQAWDAGAKVIILPTVPFGVQSGQLDIPFCLHINPSTQSAILFDLAQTLQTHNIQKLVVLNGHGGNDFKTIIRELQPKLKIFLCAINWYSASPPKQFFDEPGDHAGELETSMLLHIAPDLVLSLDQAGAGEEKQFRIEGLRNGLAWAPRQWTKISKDTGVGNPKAATAEKGEQFSKATSKKISDFLVELAKANVEDMYEK